MAKERQKIGKLESDHDTVLMKRQIEAMALQIRQLLKYKIAYCDQELLYIHDSEQEKKRTIAKKRNAYWKELD